MDRVTEHLLSEFSEERGISKLGEDKRFEHFCTFVMVGLHYGNYFDMEEVLVGKATGIDSIAIICNEELVTDIETVRDIDIKEELDVTFVFVQSERSSSFDSNKLGGLGFAVRDFFSDAPRLSRNAEISAAAEIMAELYKRSSRFKRNPLCQLYYVTTGIWNDDKILEARRQTVKSDLQVTSMFRAVEMELIDAGTLQKYYRQTKNAVECEFVFEKQLVIPEIPGVAQAYLGFLPLPQFMKILTDDRGLLRSGLFNSNPRDWQGFNEVNQEIQTTLKTDAKKRFVLMNNGVTILAREVRQTASKFLIKDYQIVNGCQTSHLLFEETENKDDSIMIPVRLISTTDEAVIKSVIRATNRQTQVPEDQFFALEEFPKQLEDFFQAFSQDKKLYYERRSRQYDRLPIEKARILTQPNVIKAFAAMFLDLAHSTTRNYSALKARVGQEIFGKGHRKEPYYASAYAFYKLECLFKSGRLGAEYKPTRFHILLAARRIATKNAPLPRINSYDMENLSNQITEILWESDQADDLLLSAAMMVHEVASGDFERDKVRTEPFTKKVIQKCEEEFRSKV